MQQSEDEMRSFIPINEQFPDGNYPFGEICEYQSKNDDRTAMNRMTNEEKKVKHYLAIKLFHLSHIFYCFVWY